MYGKPEQVCVLRMVNIIMRHYKQLAQKYSITSVSIQKNKHGPSMALICLLNF